LIVIKLDILNSWSEAEASAAFRQCCGSTKWADQMTSARPFGSEAELLDAARQIWRDLPRADWLEALAAHARIGDVSAREQAGIVGAPQAMFAALAEGNHRYEARFGHMFIVCASGKSAAEMLALLQERLPNNPDKELQIAALEQEKITLLRLQKITP
jgi:2-oxo-4-hydroxy-4-carboxy-5-ureidoimidazoline decarboxylase